MKSLRIAGLAAVLAVAAGAASAAVVHATDVVSADQNGTPVAVGRSDSGAALGATDGRFYSLGLGGDLTVGFGTSIRGKTEIKLTEVTYGPISGYGEAVDVIAVLAGVETLIGTLTNAQAQSNVGLFYAGTFDSLRFLDVTAALFPTSPSRDGLDIDSIQLSSIMAVPTPVAAGMLLTGLVGFGVVGARRRLDR